MTLEHPDSPAQWAAARRLVEEYARSLPIDLGFQDFEHEIVSLAHEYGPPQGHFVLAALAGAHVGCGGLRRFSDGVCEMKRLYVVPPHRSEGVGRAIAEALVNQARVMGYRTMMLDTLPAMDRAQALYAALGFKPAIAYRYNPAPGASFWRLDLDRD